MSVDLELMGRWTLIRWAVSGVARMWNPFFR
jgi:hypothetical protein